MAQELPIILSKSDNHISARRISFFRLLLVSMRPHQWVKNFFIFAPLLFGRKLTDFEAIGYSLLAFIVFCFLGSGLYIINDWIDAEEDRAHPEKCKRPISSGLLPVSFALFGAVVLGLTAFGIASLIGTGFFLLSALYFILMLSYSLALKRMIVLESMIIAFGFVLRVVGGAIAIGVMPTHWLIICAFLLALFLAFTKRRQELLTLLNNAPEHREVLSQYSVSYLDQVNTILIASAVVCYALYSVSPETLERFKTDKLIYGTVFVIYGMLRYLALIKDSSNGGDPSKVLLRDKPLLVAIIGWVIYNTAIINIYAERIFEKLR